MLGNTPQNDLLRLAAQTQMSLAQMQQQASAQAAMSNASQHIEVPQVNFYPSQHSNPKKSAKKGHKTSIFAPETDKKVVFLSQTHLGR